MQPNSPIGSINDAILSSQPKTEDFRTSPLFWLRRAESLDRMVLIGVERCNAVYQARLQGQSLVSLQKIHFPIVETFFTASLVIENLLKGALVIQYPDAFENRKPKIKEILSHNLNKIAEKAQVKLTLDESDFCELASRTITSFGRCEVPSNVYGHPAYINVEMYAFKVYRSLYGQLHQLILDDALDNSIENQPES